MQRRDRLHRCRPSFLCNGCLSSVERSMPSPMFVIAHHDRVRRRTGRIFHRHAGAMAHRCQRNKGKGNQSDDGDELTHDFCPKASRLYPRRPMKSRSSRSCERATAHGVRNEPVSPPRARGHALNDGLRGRGPAYRGGHPSHAHQKSGRKSASRAFRH